MIAPKNSEVFSFASSKINKDGLNQSTTIVQGGPNKPPVGGQQANIDMWAPVVTSSTDSSPDWVQVGSRDGGTCNKHTVYGPVNGAGTWMTTREEVPYKKIYSCCCSVQGKFIVRSSISLTNIFVYSV